MIPLKSILYATTKAVAENFPQDVYIEDDNTQGFDKSCFFVQILPISSSAITRISNLRTISVSIKYLQQAGESITNIYDASDRLEKIFGRTLFVDDTYLTVDDIESNIYSDEVGRILDFMIHLDFDDIKYSQYTGPLDNPDSEPTEYELMKELHLQLNELRNITITIDYNNVICFLQRTEIVFMNNIFAERLKKAMEQKNMKQIDLVKKAAEQGVKLGKSHVSQYLSGKTTPRSEILNFLATTLGVETEWLKGTDVSVDTLKKETNEAGIQMENMKFDYNYNNMKENTRETVEEVQVREFKKSSKLNNVLYDVRGPVVEEAARMENAGTQVLKLNIGNPAPFGFRTPDEVIYDMRQQLTECEGYSPAKGLFSARKAIMQYAQLKKLPNVSIEDIYTGNGVSELINLCMSALLDNGDEILIPSPDYPLWTACATLAGGKAVHYICDEQAEWYPDMDDIRKKITSRTKAIVIINPNNPTGALYPREILQQIVDIAREHHLIIFSDEIYDRLVMDGAEHISIASMAPDLFCVTFSGLSKSHMIAGFRIGWMILSGNKAVAKDYIEGIKMLSNMRLCSNVPAQSIVQTALGGHQSVESYIVPGGRIYEQREFIYNALTDIPGITAVKPKAAFYMFPKIDTKKFNIVNDEKFALDLLKEKKILLVHGGGFNWHQPDHFRVVYLPRIEVLKEAAGKIRDFLEYYQQEI